MEEERKESTPKLSYDELKNNFDNLMMQYQKLMGEYRQAIDSLNQLDYTQFFLGLLFRVMEHPNRYNEKFVNWCSANIEGAVQAFAAQREQPETEKKDEAK